jgi:hypothetical protein
LASRGIEIWRAVPNYPDYEVSNLGRLRSRRKLNPPKKTPLEPRILCDSKDKFGYPTNPVINEQGRRTFHRHTLVMATFGPPRPSGHEFGVTDAAVYDIKHKRNWKELL